MTKFSVGDMVVSLCGHDKGRYLIVIGVDGDRVTVCDGKARLAEKKKTKKNKHIKSTGLNTDLINKADDFALNAVVRKEIKRLTQSL